MRVLFFAVVLGACYSPAPQPGAPCGERGACPSGLSCIDNLCVKQDGAPPDGSPDVAIDTMSMRARRLPFWRNHGANQECDGVGGP